MSIRTASLGSKERYSIRKIFLLPRESYSIKDAARFLCMSLPDLVARLGVANGKDARLSWRQLVQLAMQRWPITTIYAHLGDDASKVLPSLTAPTPITLSIPGHVELILRAEAQRRRVDVSVLLTALLLEASGEVVSKLAAEVPGFGAAVRFPSPGE